MKTKIFADGADLKSIEEMASHPLVKGFTTNPTLMRKAGVTDYVKFAKEAIKIAKDKPISFEVFADDFAEMESQAFEIASWGETVYVKIPVTNTKGEPSFQLIRDLAQNNVQLNITALFTLEQVEQVVAHLSKTKAIISVFAGRIADTGIDPLPTMKKALALIQNTPSIELLWASTREILNLSQANYIGCHIITMAPEMIKRTPLLNKNLNDYSLETVKMFYTDALASKFEIPITAGKL